MIETDINVELENVLHSVKSNNINSVEKAPEERRDIIHREKMPLD